MIRTAQEALDLVRARGAVTLVPAGAGRSLFEAVAGGPVRGSWWGHPRGKLIFALASALEGSPEVLALKLAQGKVTFLHRSL